MSVEFPTGHQHTVESFGRKHRTGLLTLVFTDMVGSTELKRQLGDHRAADFFEQHHQLVRETLRPFPQADEIETAGDSFLLVFATPSEAVRFSLTLQLRLRLFGRDAGVEGLDRIGIHVGEVVLSNEQRNDLFGIQIDTCSRVMSLAKGGQVLMTRPVFDSARQVLKGEDIAGIGALEWLNHGPYLLKGLGESVEICEVREAAQGSNAPPADSDKARRQVREEEEPVLGWRPSLGQLVPNTRWLLEKKLGEGGFGEVWLGRHQHTKERRVFKFCFDAERVRFLKRETTLFRLLKERVGEHPNITRLNDVYLAEPPFYLEMDYVEGADLRTWSDQQGGLATVPLETRLEIVAQAADGLQAAHDAGIIHRDIKPANILVALQNPRSATGQPLPSDERAAGGEGAVRVKLTDFGIGQVVSEEYLRGITRAGFTQTLLSPFSSSGTGTQLYMAPELLAGKPASARSDIYSLGVVLYQLLAEDFTRPVTTDWANSVPDPLLREDLVRCFAGVPEQRFESPGMLARQLRTLPERRVEQARRAAEKAALERAAYKRGMLRMAGLATVVVVLIAGLAIAAWQQSRAANAAAANEKALRLQQRRDLYVANMNVAQIAWDENNMVRLRQLLAEAADFSDRGFEWFYWQRQLHLDLRTIRHLGTVTALAYSPDGRELASGGDDGLILIWNPSTGDLLRSIEAGSPVKCLTWSPDGRRILSGNWRRATVWDSRTGHPIVRIHDQVPEVVAVAFAPDGEHFATAVAEWAEGKGDRTAAVWDAQTGQRLFSLIGHADGIFSIAFSPDGKQIVTGSRDHTAKVWSAADGAEQLTLRGHEKWINCVAFSPDGSRIATASDDLTTRVWEAATGQTKLILRGHKWADVTGVAFSPDGTRIATGGGDRTVHLWDAATGDELRIFYGHTEPVLRIAFSPDGRQLASAASGAWWQRTAENTIKIWDLTSPPESLLLQGHTGVVPTAMFSADGGRVVTSSSDKRARVWDAASGQVLVDLVHTNHVVCACFSPDGATIATACADGNARIWDAHTGQLRVTMPHGDPMWWVAFSPDGRLLLSSGGAPTPKIWDATTGKLKVTLRGHTDWVWSGEFSPDGRRVATASRDRTGRVWDVSSGRETARLEGHEDIVVTTAFSHDGRRIVTGSSDHTARVWDAETGKLIKVLRAHNDQLRSGTFSSDDQRILTASSDQTARVWDAVSYKELLALRGHKAEVRAAFSPDARQIVTASMDRTARVWMTATPDQVDAWQKQQENWPATRAELVQQSQACNLSRAARARDPGALKQWLVLGPIPLSARSGDDMWEEVGRNQVPEEGRLQPRLGDRVRVQGQDLTWKAVRQDDYTLDFNQLFGKTTEWSAAYAVCYIYSDTARGGLVLYTGSDNEARIYLNGREVFRQSESRPYCLDDDEIGSGINLRAGLNTIVFKALNCTGPWQGSIRFSDANGQPVPGIRVDLWPDSVQAVPETTGITR